MLRLFLQVETISSISDRTTAPGSSTQNKNVLFFIEISNKFKLCFLNLRIKKTLYFVWSAKRREGGGETITHKIH